MKKVVYGIKNKENWNKLIKYYYIQKKMSIKEIARKTKIGKTKILIMLKQQNITPQKDITLDNRLKLGFHLYHRLLFPINKASKIANISINTLKRFCLKKKVLIRHSSFNKLSKEHKVKFIKLWKDNRIYNQKYNFCIPSNYSNIICSKIGDLIIHYYCNLNMSALDIYKKNLIPIPSNTILNFLKKNNIKIKKPEYYYTKYSVNKYYFTNINSEEKAYWLGFILGDGCIGGVKGKNLTLSITLKKEDISHLLKFKQAINSESPIKTFLVNNKYEACSLTISNTFLAKSLSQYGVIKNKTYSATFPNIPEKYYTHFIRGLFDADGSLPKSNGKIMGYSFCGTLYLMKSIADILHIDYKYLYIREDLVNFAELRCHCREKALKVLNNIYNNANVYLERKYKRYIEYKKYN